MKQQNDFSINLISSLLRHHRQKTDFVRGERGNYWKKNFFWNTKKKGEVLGPTGKSLKANEHQASWPLDTILNTEIHADFGVDVVFQKKDFQKKDECTKFKD